MILLAELVGGGVVVGTGDFMGVFVDENFLLLTPDSVRVFGDKGFDEVFAALGAIVVGEKAGEGTDFEKDDVVRFGGERSRQVFDGLLHEDVPDGSGTGVAGFEVGAHGGVVVVADPNGDETGIGSGSVANRPVVSFFFGSAGFDTDRLSGNVEDAASAEGAGASAVIEEDVRDEKGDFGGKNIIIMGKPRRGAIPWLNFQF